MNKKTTTSYVKLPKQLITDIKAQELSKTQTSHSIKFVGILLRDSHQDFGNYSTFTDKPQTFLLKAFDKKYNSWLNILLNAGIVICDNVCSPITHKAYAYAVNQKYFTTELTITDLENVPYKDIVKEIDFDYDLIDGYVSNDFKQLVINTERLHQITNDVVSNVRISNYKVNNQIKVDTIELIDSTPTYTNKYHISLEKAITKATEKGFLIIEDKRKYFIVDEQTFIQNKKAAILIHYTNSIEQLANGNFKFGINNTNGRLDTNITNMPSVLVDQIIEDSGLIQKDMVNSQFAVLSNVLKGELNTIDYNAFKQLSFDGKLYEYIQDNLGLETRKEGKYNMFELLFSSYKNNSKGKAILKTLFPSIVRWIDDYKKVNGSNNFSIMLQRKESEIFIQNVWMILKQEGIFCITKHDSLIIKKEDAKRIREILKELFSKLDFNCKMITSKQTPLPTNEVAVVEIVAEIVPNSVIEVEILVTVERYFDKLKRKWGSWIAENKFDEIQNYLLKVGVRNMNDNRLKDPVLVDILNTSIDYKDDETGYYKKLSII